MKKDYLTKTLLFLAALMLIGCKSSILGDGSCDVTYLAPNGEEIAASRVETSNGRVYYVVRLGTMNYQQAFAMQKDGWVLPRMYGLKNYDEHRTTIMPTMELLLKEQLPAPNADVETDHFKAVDNKMKAILDETESDKSVYWTATRFPKRGEVRNYALSYSKSSGECILQTADYDEECEVVLLKDEALVTDTVPDNAYYTNEGNRIESEFYKGNDGYDYYIVTLKDTAYTWYEAVAMEKDGWLLPRNEGIRYGGGNSIEMWNKVKQYTWHTDGIEPSLEGLLGCHPIHSSMPVTNQQKKLFPIGMWTATPIDEQQAWLLGQDFFRVGTISSYIENEKYKKIGYVTLVKRIPAGDDAESRYSLSGKRYVQGATVTGASGTTYYVVDPSGWQDFIYRGDQVQQQALAKDGWHLLTLEEFNDMLGLVDEQQVSLGSQLQQYNNDLFHSVFTAGNIYYATLENGDLIQVEPYFHTYAQNEWGLSVHGVIKPGQLRLAKVVDDGNVVEAEKASDPLTYGLKGQVYKIEITDYNTSEWNNEYHPTSSINNNVMSLSFNKNGQVTSDYLQNVYRYNKDGSFRKGLHDYTQVKRNKSGQIVEYRDDDGGDNVENFTAVYEYNAKGLLSKMSYNGWSEVSKTNYVYDDDGHLVEVKSEGSFEGGGTFKKTVKYQNKETDEHGNVTERVAIINYSETNDGDIEEGEDQPAIEEKTNVIYQKLKISYFK